MCQCRYVWFPPLSRQVFHSFLTPLGDQGARVPMFFQQSCDAIRHPSIFRFDEIFQCTGKRGPEMRPEAEKPRNHRTSREAEKYETLPLHCDFPWRDVIFEVLGDSLANWGSNSPAQVTPQSCWLVISVHFSATPSPNRMNFPWNIWFIYWYFLEVFGGLGVEFAIRGGWNFFHSSDWCWLPVRMYLKGKY